MYSSDNSFVTQEQTIFCKTHDNVYQGRITGVKNKLISQFCLKISFPEIRGAGQVAYIKHFLYLAIRCLKFKITNHDGTIIDLPALNGYDLYRLAKQNRFTFDYNKKMNKKYCKTRNGDKSDTVIYKMKDMFIHLALPFDTLLLQRSAYLDIVLQLEPEDTIITYNAEFEPHLSTYLHEASSFAKNIVLQYTTYMDVEDYQSNLFIFNRNESPHGTILTVSNDFQSAIRLNIFARPEILSSNQNYLMNPAAIEDPDKLISAALENFKDDLVTTEITEADKKNYILIPENGIVLFKKSQKKCLVSILNRPDNVNFFFHSKILSYSRRNDLTHYTNVSEMFQEIRVLYAKERLVIDVIKHTIPLWVVCLPVSFWSHMTNTSPGDLRSDESKAKDFVYQNRFINSIDFLNRTPIIDSITLLLPSQQIKYKSNSCIQTCFGTLEENNIEIPLSRESKPILPEPHRLENFSIEIKTKHVDRHSIRDLYTYKIVDEVIEKKYLQSTPDQKIALSISPN